MSLTDVMSAAGLSSWTELALVLCLAVFAAIVIWVFVVRSKRSYDPLRNLPLEDDRAENQPSPAQGGKTT